MPVIAHFAAAALAVLQLTSFGERAAWAPDGRRIAFMERSFGQALELDLRTRRTRNLTGRFPNAGYLRVQYLPDGDRLLLGARTFTDPVTTRARDEEMWLLPRGSRRAPLALGQKVAEGVAISRRRPLVAWANTHDQYPAAIPPGESVLYVARVVRRGGRARLAGRRAVLRGTPLGCTLEAQDFRRRDRELVFTCYGAPGGAGVMGVDLRSGRVTTYRRVAGEYDEAEGVSPDGRWCLVESSRGQHFGGIDIWRLALSGPRRTFTRLTHFGERPGFRATDPVVSPDGRRVAFQSARTGERAGVGHGIFLLKLRRPL